MNIIKTLTQASCSIFLFMTFINQVEGQDVIKTTYTYKKVGDLEIQADVYRKTDETIHPVLFWIHGGALIMGNRRQLNPVQANKYLNAGFTVISVDYRLAPQVKIKEIIEDIRDAYLWVRTDGPELFRIDPDRIVVTGHSAGGYLSLMSGFILKPSPCAIVSFYGYGDIAGEWYSRPDPYYNREQSVAKEDAYSSVGTHVVSDDQSGKRGKFYLYCRQKGLWPLEVAGYDPDTEPNQFDLLCPLRNVTDNYPPTLLLHGDKDTDVPYEQSVMMANELKKYGIQHELITMKGQGHGFDSAMEDPEVNAAFAHVLDFIKKWTNH